MLDQETLLEIMFVIVCRCLLGGTFSIETPVEEPVVLVDPDPFNPWRIVVARLD